MNGDSSSFVSSESMDKSALVPVSWHVGHALASILAGVNVHHGRTHTDFGQGFYTTTVERQAQAWTWQLSQRIPETLPAVIRFNIDRDLLAALQCVWFVRGSFDADDFWSLISYCHTEGGHHTRATNHGWYDVAIGPARHPGDGALLSEMRIR